MMLNNSATTLIVTAVFGVVSTGVLVYVLKKNKRKWKIPTEWKEVGHVEKLYLFPLKSGHFMKLDEVECTEIGFRLLKNAENPLQLRDRSFMVYGESDKAIKSGRTFPSLVKIELTVHDEHHVALESPNMPRIIVKIPQKNNTNTLFVNDWTGDTIGTIDCGNEVAEWLSQHLSESNSGYRLGYHDGSKRRKFVKRLKPIAFYKNLTDDATGLFSDITSVMIINQASVDDCASKVSSEKITHLYFRGNIVVAGPNLKPFEEDHWDWIKVGDVIMRNVKDCTRCAFTNVNPETGVRSAYKEPITSLLNYRMSRGPENASVMGIHTDVRKNGTIKSGDPVYIGYS